MGYGRKIHSVTEGGGGYQAQSTENKCFFYLTKSIYTDKTLTQKYVYFNCIKNCVIQLNSIRC